MNRGPLEHPTLDGAGLSPGTRVRLHSGAAVGTVLPESCEDHVGCVHVDWPTTPGFVGCHDPQALVPMAEPTPAP